MAEKIKEQILAEVSGEARYCLLGIPAVPLWFVLSGLKSVKGVSLMGKFALSWEEFISNPYMLVAALVVEFVIFLSYMRISHQKLVLTETKLVSLTGIFKVEKKEYALTSIQRIYTVIDRDIFSKRLGCSTLKLKLLEEEEEMAFPIMKNTVKFVDLVSRQMTKVKSE